MHVTGALKDKEEEERETQNDLFIQIFLFLIGAFFEITFMVTLFNQQKGIQLDHILVIKLIMTDETMSCISCKRRQSKIKTLKVFTYSHSLQRRCPSNDLQMYINLSLLYVMD